MDDFETICAELEEISAGLGDSVKALGLDEMEHKMAEIDAEWQNHEAAHCTLDEYFAVPV